MDQVPGLPVTPSPPAIPIKIEQSLDYGSWYWFIFITVIFLFLWYALLSVADVAEVSRNWPKYRCSPTVMPFASAYGYNTSENFNYCVQNIFKGQMGEATGPYNTILGTLILNMMRFLQNLNSLRIMLATLLGGITKVFQEFTDRFKLFMSQVQQSALRLQMLMKRVFGTFYAVIYMGLSAVAVGNNFSQSFIFKFIDTFCFAPETLVAIEGKGLIPVWKVCLGDRFSAGGEMVKSVYRFMADGQTMVQFGSIHVSTNHLVRYNDQWIMAKDHPDAIPTSQWNGGPSRPLVCLDTDTHTIPIGLYTFSDWDETSESDGAVMTLAETRLNGVKSIAASTWLYQPALDGSIEIRMADGSVKRMDQLILGDALSTGIVTGLGIRNVEQVCEILDGLDTFLIVSPSQLVWDTWTGIWIRAGHKYPIKSHTRILYTVVVSNTAILETRSGSMFRDMLEVHSEDMETPTLEYLRRQ
jgi:hypothetical protein